MAKLNPKQDIKYGFYKIMTGSDLSSRRLAVMETGSKNPGPTVWLTAAVHGDEVGGIIVIQEIFKKIKETSLLKGAIKAFPLMNPVGFESASREIPGTDEDLNRSFPGNKSGSLSERIADKIFKMITESQPSLVLDLHNDWTTSIPYILLDPKPVPAARAAYDEAKRIAKASGFLMIEEGDEDIEEMQSSLSGSLINAGIPALTIELGESFVVNEDNVRDGIAAVWRMLAELGMVEADTESDLRFNMPPQYRAKILVYANEPDTETSGLIRWLVKPGDIVAAGQPIARIYNVFGKLQETAKAEHEGIILGHPDSAVSYPGESVAALGVFRTEIEKGKSE